MTRYAAKGTFLQRGDGATAEAFTTIAQLTNIGGIEVNQESEDVTDHGSTDFFREHVETVAAIGTIAFEGHWDPENATHIAMLGAAGDGDGPYNYKIIWVPATTTASFAATIENLKVGYAPIEGKLLISGTLKVSGKVTWT